MKCSAKCLAIVIVLAACQDATRPDVVAPPDMSLEIIGAGDGAALDTSDATHSATRAPSLSVQAAKGEQAHDVTCVGAFTGTAANIVVPPGATCIIANAVVHGNITALENALLGVRNSRVHGNVIGDKADVMQIRNNVIEGNLEMAEGGPHPVFLEVALCGNELPSGNIKVIKMRGGVGISPFAFCVPPSPNVLQRGNMSIEDNILDVPGRRLFVSQNQVGQNLQVYMNKGPFEKIVFNNVAGESVQCFDNEAPFFGGPNTAPKREGQCF
jgi:hypothetical protein